MLASRVVLAGGLGRGDQLRLPGGGRVRADPGSPGREESGWTMSAPRGLGDFPLVPQLGKAYGVESHVLSPAETKALYPLMNVDDLYGTLYVPHDGTMDPAGTCTTLSRAAAARGAQVPTPQGALLPSPGPSRPGEASPEPSFSLIFCLKYTHN